MSYMRQVTAVVLAGGFGTRVAHLLPGVPKPMAEVAGKPFLEWVVLYLARQGVKDVLLSTGHLAQVIEKHFQSDPVPGVRTRCIAETQPLGTAGGFLNAARLSGDHPATWLVLNGDSLVLAELGDVARELDEPAVAGVLVGCEVPDASRFGTLAIGPAGQLQGFLEKRPGKGVISGGVYLLRDSFVRNISGKAPLSFELDVFPRVIRDGAALKVATVAAPFLDIGTPETLRQAEDFVRQNQAQFTP